MTSTLETPVVSESFQLPEDISFDVTDDDTAPALPAICAEPGCENPVVRTSNKGPAPKFCPEHKSAAKDSVPRTPRVSRAKWAEGPAVEAALISSLEFLALPAAMLPEGAPLYKDAGALLDYGPKIIHELCVLGQNDKRIRDTLTRLSMPGKYGPLAGACLALVFAVASNHGLFPAALTGLLQNSSRG